MKFLRLLCLVSMLAAPLAHAWNRPEMAKYGAAYAGPELLFVYVAHNKADNGAVVKIHGINHPCDNRVFWLKPRYTPRTAANTLIEYIDDSGKESFVMLRIQGSSGALFLRGYRGETIATLPLNYDLQESRQTLPEHLLTEYANQIGEKP